LINKVGSLFWYFELLNYVCDIVVKRFTNAISSPDEFLICNIGVLWLNAQQIQLVYVPLSRNNVGEDILFLAVTLLWCRIRRKRRSRSASGFERCEM